jgi:hypothetical protein
VDRADLKYKFIIISRSPLTHSAPPPSLLELNSLSTYSQPASAPSECSEPLLASSTAAGRQRSQRARSNLHKRRQIKREISRVPVKNTAIQIENAS